MFLKLPLSISIIGSDYFAIGDMEKKAYLPFSKDLLEHNKEILGLNILNSDGKIVRVYPEEKNPNTLGKISQNIERLEASYKKGEKYYLSRPFTLYQGQQGFALYRPLIEGKKLKGWFATAVSSEQFYSNYRLEENLRSYNFIIKDKISGQNYFSTGTVPESTSIVHTHINKLLGRDVIFISWEKNPSIFITNQWNIPLYFSLVLSLVICFFVYFHQQKKLLDEQLENIQGLLNLSAKEALVNLIDLHGQFHNSRFDSYLTNYIEQIHLMQTMAQSSEKLENVDNNFCQITQKQIKNLKEIIEKKNITIKSTLNPDLTFFASEWLIENTVLSNILSHCIIYAKQGSILEISCIKGENDSYINFHVTQTEDPNEAIKINRRIEVAKRALQIYQGDLTIQKDLNQGFILRIHLET